IKQFGWTDNPRYLLYMQDTDGNEDWHLYRVDLENPEAAAVDLTPMDPGSRVVGWAPAKWAPGHLAVSMNVRPMFFDTFLVNVATGEARLPVETPALRESYFTDADGVVRFHHVVTDDGTHEYAAVNPDTMERRVICRLGGPEHPLAVLPAQPTVDGTGLLLGV